MKEFVFCGYCNKAVRPAAMGSGVFVHYCCSSATTFSKEDLKSIEELREAAIPQTPKNEEA